MPTENIVALLTAERDKLNRAIEILQETYPAKGLRGETSTGTTAEATPGRFASKPAARGRKRTFSAKQRAEQAARMRAYWAKRKKAAK